MTKAKISEYDAVASNNTDVNGVNIAEGCPPSGMNNMGREIMAALKRFQVGSDGDGVTVGGNLVVSGSSTLSTTSISSADINAGTIDGTTIGGASAAVGTFTQVNVDNLRLDGNAITSTNSNGSLDITPNGTGDVNLNADTVRIGDSNVNAVLTTNGTGDLTLSTNAGTNSGVITIADGANGNITITPNGTGEVDITKVDINGGTIDGTAIGGSTAAAGSFTTLGATGDVTIADKIVHSGDTNTAIRFPAADNVAIETGGVERVDFSNSAVVFNESGANVDFRVEGDAEPNLLFVDASADAVGIGTNSPTVSGTSAITLHTKGSSGVSVGLVACSSNDGGSSVSLYSGQNNTDNPAITYQRSLRFGSTTDAGAGGFAERMRITSGGELYIAGTTDQGAYNLQVNGTGVWGQGAYVNGSDERMKQNIADLQDGLSVITQLRPVTYQYREEFSKDQSTQPGFIAQELQTVLDGKDYKDGVVPEGPEYLNVAYQNLIPILTKAIQELKAELDTVKAELATLKG